MCKDEVIDLYGRHAQAYDRDRRHSLQERAWLNRFLAHVPAGGTVLDMGCGTGEPIARYLMDRGVRVFGVDAASSMIEICRERFPEADWLVADMRKLELDQRFDGILAWDSFFHLDMDDQREMFRRFASHARQAAPLMFTSGPAEGEAIGSCYEEQLYHASLDPTEYEKLLNAHGFVVREFIANDPECEEHTIWLATYDLEVTV